MVGRVLIGEIGSVVTGASARMKPPWYGITLGQGACSNFYDSIAAVPLDVLWVVDITRKILQPKLVTAK